MARLPSVNQNRTILQADLRGAPADVAANPFMTIANVLGDVGQRIHKSELDTAEQQGQNAVYRDQDGNLQVTLKDNSTDTARAYNHAAQLGMLSRLQSDIRTQGQIQADAAKGDPAVFNTGWNTYQKGILKNAPDDLKGPIQAQLDQYGAQYSLGVSEIKRKRDIAVFEADTKAEAQNLMDEMATLARGGGTNTPDYQAKRGQLVSLYQNMVANPDFTMSQKQADIDLKHAESRNMAEAMAGSVTNILQKDGVVAARKQAEGILTDTSLNLSPAERRQYAGIMSETINGYVAQQKVALKPFQEQAEQAKKLLDQHVGIDNPAIDDIIGNLARGGDPQGALALSQARNSARVIRDFKLANPEERVQIAENGIAAANGVPAAAPTGKTAGLVDTETNTQTGKLFSSIEQKNGLPAGYLARTMQIESGGRNLGPNSAGAEGYFQFVPSTADRMGVNPRDLYSSADGAGRLAAESARYLRTGLGRDPTAAELYLAHQQGAGGAMKLLTNPNENAASLVGTKAIIQNGGREDMTAAQFVQMWANKFDGTKGTTTSIPSGAGLGVDPEAVKAYREGITADAKTYWSDIQDGIKKGYSPDPQEFALFGRQLALVDDPNFKAEVGRFMNSEAAGQVIAQLPPQQRAAVMSSLQANAADGATLAQQDLVSAAARYTQQSQEALSKDPIGYAASRNIAPPVPALDFGAGIDSIGAAMAARQKAVDLLRARGEVGNISALRPDDTTMLSNFIQTAKPSDQAALLGTLSRSLSPDTFKATMADLAQKADTNALATAGALYAENPDVAQSVIRGRALLTQNPNFAPKKTDANNESIDQILPPTSFGAGLEGGRQQLIEAAKARYADLSNFAGDTSGELNSTRMTQAINDVTGGALTMNGDTVLAPQYGMKQDQFDQMMKNLPPEAVAGAITADGTPITARDIWRQGRLKSIGDGQYLIDFAVSGNTPSYAVAAPIQTDSRIGRVPGGPFILDLRKK